MKTKTTLVFLVIATLLAACGTPNTQNTQDQGPTPDIAAIRTSAASTVVSQFTLTAAAFTPTTAPTTQPVDTPAPAVTSTATVAPLAQVTNALGTTVALCDSLQYIADVNVPDDTKMSPGQDFVKTWRVKNTGSCPWGAGYKLVYAGYEDDMSGQPQALTQVVQPGQEVELSVQLTAPDTADQYVSAWQMSNPKGITFGDAIYVRIIVQ